MFQENERSGMHILPAHFYSSVPTLATVPDAMYTERSAMVGVKTRDEAQRAFLHSCKNAAVEFNSLFDATAPPRNVTTRYWTANPSYMGADGIILWCMVRTKRPKRIIELGSGFTTLLMGQAAVRNKAEGFETSVTSFDPYFKLAADPSLVPGLTSLRMVSAQNMDPADIAAELGPGDILFIDTTHVVTFASDCRHIILEILPRVPVGVYVHIHDIFLPQHYPRAWMTQMLRFWTEQYLLQAFLISNSDWEIEYMGNYLSLRHYAEVKEVLGFTGGGNFWMRRVAA